MQHQIRNYFIGAEHHGHDACLSETMEPMIAQTAMSGHPETNDQTILLLGGCSPNGWNCNSQSGHTSVLLLPP